VGGGSFDDNRYKEHDKINLQRKGLEERYEREINGKRHAPPKKNIFIFYIPKQGKVFINITFVISLCFLAGY
jgi:hypothetical protein